MFKSVGKIFAPGLLAISITSASFGVALAAIPVPAMAAELASSGQFQGADSARQTSGNAEIIRLDGGGYGLKLHGDFRSTNAPDLRIWLSEASSPRNEGAVQASGYTDLGALKSTSGEQVYRIPDGVDISKVRSAVIWCREFSVFFGSASLT